MFWDREKGIKHRLRILKSCLMAHPDNEENSEFADRIEDIEIIEMDIERLVSKDKVMYTLNQCDNLKDAFEMLGSICKE